MKVETISIPARRNSLVSNPRQSLFFVMLASLLLMLQAVMGQARGAPESFADLAEKVSPSVVNITTTTTVAVPTGPMPGPIVPEGSPFEDFFRDFMDRGGNGDRPRRSQALGSGFVISEDGFIVTNNHVIAEADEIEIEFFDGRILPAKLVGRDPKIDIALLKVESDEPLPFVSFGDSDIMRVGDWVMAMGNPLGQGFSVSAGIISARRAFGQTKRANRSHVSLFKQITGMCGINGWRIQQRNFDKIHFIVNSGRYGLFCTGSVPIHGPHACMYAKTFHTSSPLNFKCPVCIIKSS